jgi:GalNAc-alpha-(1->4)-GalNAc-alpha-(1->3)-diNAcBac-PP-undecaprenol alpha-1,4-N-acetyl-D-galactosaminyltransferase
VARPRIALVIWSLAGGGAERVLSILASHWAKRGWNIYVLTLESVISRIAYELDPAVVVHPVGFDPPASTVEGRWVRLPVTLRLIPAIRKLRPDVVIAFMPETNVKVLLATLGTDVPVFACERIDPRANPLPFEWALLRSVLYRRAAAIVAQTDEALSFFSRRIQRRGAVIPNPVLPPPSTYLPRLRHEVVPSRRVIGLGRLCQQKRFDRLLMAFGKVAPRHPEWSLEIWGEGDLRESLERMVAAVGLANRIYLRGFTHNPDACLCKADLFVLSSDTEGFPNALCEAMARGLPVISVDCPSGPRQIIRHGIDGLLTPAGDMDALAAAMDWLMGDATVRARLASRAPEILERFNLDHVLERWDRLFARYIPGLKGLAPAAGDSARVTSCVG